MNADDPRAALCAYTLSLGDAAFTHQHVVDALIAQEADAATPTMQLTFALVGLYLRVERGYTGRRVQQAHAALARRRPVWPRLELPAARGSLRAGDVLATPVGPARDAAIDDWCAAVWAAYGACREAVVGLVDGHGLA